MLPVQWMNIINAINAIKEDKKNFSSISLSPFHLCVTTYFGLAFFNRPNDPLIWVVWKYFYSQIFSEWCWWWQLWSNASLIYLFFVELYTFIFSFMSTGYTFLSSKLDCFIVCFVSLFSFFIYQSCMYKYQLLGGERERWWWWWWRERDPLHHTASVYSKWHWLIIGKSSIIYCNILESTEEGLFSSFCPKLLESISQYKLIWLMELLLCINSRKIFTFLSYFYQFFSPFSFSSTKVHPQLVHFNQL